MQEEKLRVEKTNEILLETVKVAQTQKDIYCEEQEKIQNMQQNEIDKLRSLLSFREQEAVDRLNAMRQHQTQVENLTSELERFKHYETEVEDLKVNTSLRFSLIYDILKADRLIINLQNFTINYYMTMHVVGNLFSNV